MLMHLNLLTAKIGFSLIPNESLYEDGINTHSNFFDDQLTAIGVVPEEIGKRC